MEKKKQAWGVVQCSEMQVFLTKFQSFLLKMRPKKMKRSNGAKAALDFCWFGVMSATKNFKFILSSAFLLEEKHEHRWCQICARLKAMQKFMQPKRLHVSDNTADHWLPLTLTSQGTFGSCILKNIRRSVDWRWKVTEEAVWLVLCQLEKLKMEMNNI